MEVLSIHLAKLCEEHLLREKVFLAPTLAQGRQAILRLAGKGVSALNLRPATTETIALDIAGIHLARKKIEPLTEPAMGFLLEDLFLKVASRKGSYFHRFFTRNESWLDVWGLIQAGALIGAYVFARVLAWKNFIPAFREFNAYIGARYAEYALRQKTDNTEMAQ